jgi:formylglycine-generating enzyme required for sulfatase activity
MLQTKPPLKAMPILQVMGTVGILLAIFWVGSCSGTRLFLPPTEMIDDKGIPMRLVPAGEFTMGSDADGDPRNNTHTVYLDAFYMDTYEITNAHYASCVTAGVCEPPYYVKLDFRESYYGNSEFDNFPVIYVDWTMARTYCE